MDPRVFLAQCKIMTANATVKSEIGKDGTEYIGSQFLNEENAYSALQYLAHATSHAIDSEPVLLAKVQRNSPSYGIPGGWSSDEDRLLLLGVASCGVGRWTEIRADFRLERNSAQMNQRFARLAGRRSMRSEMNTQSPPLEGAAKFEEEYKEVRTKYINPDREVELRARLPIAVVKMLEDFSEATIWESIAIRHLLDMQNKDKRCGRPQKYPMPILIPKHFENDGWMNYRHLIINRPAISAIPDGPPVKSSKVLEQWKVKSEINSIDVPSKRIIKKRGRGRPRKASEEVVTEHKRPRVSVASVVFKERQRQQAMGHTDHTLLRVPVSTTAATSVQAAYQAGYQAAAAAAAAAAGAAGAMNYQMSSAGYPSNAASATGITGYQAPAGYSTTGTGYSAGTYPAYASSMYSMPFHTGYPQAYQTAMGFYQSSLNPVTSYPTMTQHKYAAET